MTGCEDQVRVPGIGAGILKAEPETPTLGPQLQRPAPVAGIRKPVKRHD
jgi:hypothetical protein